MTSGSRHLLYRFTAYTIHSVSPYSPLTTKRSGLDIHL